MSRPQLKLKIEPLILPSYRLLKLHDKQIGRENEMGQSGQVSRRTLLGATGAAAVYAGLSSNLFGAAPAIAQGKDEFKQAPGFFRYKLGDVEITIVSDGNLLIPAEALAANKPDAEVKAYLKSNFFRTDKLIAHTNLCLLKVGDKLIMVDSGSGVNFQKSAGRVVQNLAYAGYKPEDIDAIIVTHGHPDHIWGILDDATGKPRFPNAEYYVNAVEWDYWMDEELASKLPKQFAPMALGARRNLLPVSAKTKRVRAGDEILPGISLLDTPGHTVGHVSVLVVSGNEKLLITGDALVHPFVSLERPDWHFAYDSDKELASQTRKKLVDMLAKDKILTVAYHFPFPGMGHIAANGQNYRWVPVTWSWQL